MAAPVRAKRWHGGGPLLLASRWAGLGLGLGLGLGAGKRKGKNKQNTLRTPPLRKLLQLSLGRRDVIVEGVTDALPLNPDRPFLSIKKQDNLPLAAGRWPPSMPSILQ